MADFSLAIPIVFKHEGFLSDDSTDKGGITKYGLSLRWLQSEKLDIDGDGDVDKDDVRALTLDKATVLYHTYWWDAFKYDWIINQYIATKVFDTTVNVGAVQSHKFLQRALTPLGFTVAIDGNFGPKSMEATNHADPVELLEKFKFHQINFYLKLVADNPAYIKYRDGWLNRARSIQIPV